MSQNLKSTGKWLSILAIICLCACSKRTALGDISHFSYNIKDSDFIAETSKLFIRDLEDVTGTKIQYSKSNHYRLRNNTILRKNLINSVTFSMETYLYLDDNDTLWFDVYYVDLKSSCYFKILLSMYDKEYNREQLRKTAKLIKNAGLI